MPELPEVESYRVRLLPTVQGRTVSDVWVAKKNYAFLCPPGRIRRGLTGAAIADVKRLGKYLLLALDEPTPAGDAGGARRGWLLVHLGMTGQVFARPFTPDTHTHMVVSLDGAPCPLVFRDPRKFGKLDWIAGDDPLAHPRLVRLGPDATQPDAARLWGILKRRRCPVKAALLDQGVLAGIGNIYADEALFLAGVRPGRAACRLTRAEVGRLCEGIRAVLERAIEAGGSSVSDYVLPDGSLGMFQLQHRVYGRGGEPCLRCGGTVRRTVVATRGTHYCPGCQR